MRFCKLLALQKSMSLLGILKTVFHAHVMPCDRLCVCCPYVQAEITASKKENQRKQTNKQSSNKNATGTLETHQKLAMSCSTDKNL